MISNEILVVKELLHEEAITPHSDSQGIPK